MAAWDVTTAGSSGLAAEIGGVVGVELETALRWGLSPETRMARKDKRRGGRERGWEIKTEERELSYLRTAVPAVDAMPRCCEDDHAEWWTREPKLELTGAELRPWPGPARLTVLPFNLG